MTMNLSDRFLRAVNDFVLKWETEFQPGHDGDYAFARTEHDPDDPGGATKFGIDQRSHPSVNIETLSVDQAREIYAVSYWGPSHSEALPSGLGEVVFDASVNCGIGRSIQWLQQALGVSADGAIGPITLAAADQCTPERLRSCIDLREQYYRELAMRRPAMAKFLTGWLNRVEDLRAWIVTLP